MNIFIDELLMEMTWCVNGEPLYFMGWETENLGIGVACQNSMEVGYGGGGLRRFL
jgi:hypothetical protein